MTAHPDDLALADHMRRVVERRDALVRMTYEQREEWDLERAAPLLEDGIAEALSIPIVRSGAVPWRTLYAMRGKGATVTLILGDEARFPAGPLDPAGPDRITYAERERRDLLLEVRELVHRGMAHVDPQAAARRRADELTRRLFA